MHFDDERVEIEEEKKKKKSDCAQTEIERSETKGQSNVALSRLVWRLIPGGEMMGQY